MRKIRLETQWDHDSVRRLNNAAFGRSVEARLVDLLRESKAFVPQLSLVAEDNSVVIGHILFTRIFIGSDPGTAALALAPMAVYPAFQNRGVGTALVNDGLRRAEEMGEALVVVVGHPDYYPRFGFVPGRPLGIAPPWDDVPDDAFLVKTLSGYRDDMKGVVAYPPEFDTV